MNALTVQIRLRLYCVQTSLANAWPNTGQNVCLDLRRMSDAPKNGRQSEKMPKVQERT